MKTLFSWFQRHFVARKVAVEPKFPMTVKWAAEILDRHDPKWFEKIDTKELCMLMENSCIVGQLSKASDKTGFQYVNEIFDMEGRGLWWAAHSPFGYTPGYADKWKEDPLRLQWIEEIRARKGLLL